MKNKNKNREDKYKEETDNRIKTLESNIAKLREEIKELRKYKFDDLESNAKLDYKITDDHQSICVIEAIMVVMFIGLLSAYIMIL